MTVHESSSYRRRRPARSSSCQRVMMTITGASGPSRVRAVSVHQSHAAFRNVAESASLRPLCGSSTISRSAGRPVSAPPIPVQNTPPVCPSSCHSWAADVSARTRNPSVSAWVAMSLRISRPHLRATPCSYEAMTIRSSGLRVSSHNGNRRDTRWDLPSCGGIEMTNRLMRPSAMSTNARSITSNAGVCTVRGSNARASAPGVDHRVSRGREGSNIRAAASHGDKTGTVINTWPKVRVSARTAKLTPGRPKVLGGDGGYGPQMAGHHLRHPRLLLSVQVQVAEDTADHISQQGTLLLSDPHLPLLDTRRDRCLRHRHKVPALFLPQPHPRMRLRRKRGVGAGELAGLPLHQLGAAPDHIAWGKSLHLLV